MAALKCLSFRGVRPQRAVACQASNAKFFVGGNWKCNGSMDTVKTLVNDLNNGEYPDDIDVVCAPPFVYLPSVTASLKAPIATAAQNCWISEGGAYTGEVSAGMLLDLDVPWVITGHSERRSLCGETNDIVGKKTAYAISQGLKVIACIGETLDQREAGELWSVLEGQMSAIKAAVDPADWDKLVIAYEPVWAIGTGKVATPEQAQEVHAFLRQWVADNLSPEISDSLRIIYGGSVKGANAAELAAREDIDGFLVGGASLNASEFITICNAPATAASAA